MQLSQDYRATTRRENSSLFTAKHSLTPPRPPHLQMGVDMGIQKLE